MVDSGIGSAVTIDTAVVLGTPEALTVTTDAKRGCTP